MYSVSAHKIGGLKGTGALIKKKPLALRPFIFGGGQENGRRSGTENTFGIKMFEYAVSEKFKTLRADFERLKFAANGFGRRSIKIFSCGCLAKLLRRIF